MLEDLKRKTLVKAAQLWHMDTGVHADSIKQVIIKQLDSRSLQRLLQHEPTVTVGIFCEPSHISPQQRLRIREHAVQHCMHHRLTRMPLSYTMFPGTAFTSMNMIGILQQQPS